MLPAIYSTCGTVPGQQAHVIHVVGILLPVAAICDYRTGEWFIVQTTIAAPKQGKAAR